MEAPSGNNPLSERYMVTQNWKVYARMIQYRYLYRYVYISTHNL